MNWTKQFSSGICRHKFQPSCKYHKNLLCVYYDIVILAQKSLYFLHNGYMSSCEKKLNGYVNLKRTVGYRITIIGEFACYILACLSSCLITEWLPNLHSGTKWYIGHTVSLCD